MRPESNYVGRLARHVRGLFLSRAGGIFGICGVVGRPRAVLFLVCCVWRGSVVRSYSKYAPTWEDIGGEFKWKGKTYRISGTSSPAHPDHGGRHFTAYARGAHGPDVHPCYVLVDSGYMAPESKKCAIPSGALLTGKFEPYAELGTVVLISRTGQQFLGYGPEDIIPGIQAVLCRAYENLTAGFPLHRRTTDAGPETGEVMLYGQYAPVSGFALVNVPKGECFWMISPHEEQ